MLYARRRHFQHLADVVVRRNLPLTISTPHATVYHFNGGMNKSETIVVGDRFVTVAPGHPVFLGYPPIPSAAEA